MVNNCWQLFGTCLNLFSYRHAPNFHNVCEYFFLSSYSTVVIYSWTGVCFNFVSVMILLSFLVRGLEELESGGKNLLIRVVRFSLLKQVHPLMSSSYESKGSISALTYSLDMPQRILFTCWWCPLARGGPWEGPSSSVCSWGAPWSLSPCWHSLVLRGEMA